MKEEAEIPYENELDVIIKDRVPPIGFLNVHEAHTFFCEVEDESDSPFDNINMQY